VTIIATDPKRLNDSRLLLHQSLQLSSAPAPIERVAYVRLFGWLKTAGTKTLHAIEIVSSAVGIVGKLLFTSTSCLLK
jgi:hypothetical protein